MFPGDADELGRDRAAVVMVESGRTVSWGELDRRSRQLANYWYSQGCRSGSHVALLMDNVAEFAEVCWAAERSGLYYTPINSHLTSTEVAYIVDNSTATHVVTTARLRSTLMDALRLVDRRVDVLCVDDGWCSP